MKLPLSPCGRAGARLALALYLPLLTWLLLTPAPPGGEGWINDKVAHLLSFGLLALLGHASWPQRDFGWRFALPLLGYGLATECLQYFIPTRSFSLLDLLADGGGLALYAASLFLLLRLNRAAVLHRS